MATIYRQKVMLRPTPDRIVQFGDYEYFLIKPSEHQTVGYYNYASTPNSNLGLLEINSTAMSRGKPSAGWFTIAIKPYGPSGIGSLSMSPNRDTAVRISTTENTDWNVDVENSKIYIISIRTSLLAKHALGVVDTSVLNDCADYHLSPAISSLLIDRINHINKVSQQSAELDLRISHLMLAICEAISGLTQASAMKNRDLISIKALELIQAEEVKNLKISYISQQLDVGERRLDSTFKSKIGISCSQFLTAYLLNLVRKDLYLSQRTFAECVSHYEFQSADQLYRKYVKQFNEEPPIAIQAPLLPRAKTLRDLAEAEGMTSSRLRVGNAAGIN